jgi:hypothetical protein
MADDGALAALRKVWPGFRGVLPQGGSAASPGPGVIIDSPPLKCRHTIAAAETHAAREHDDGSASNDGSLAGSSHNG